MDGRAGAPKKRQTAKKRSAGAAHDQQKSPGQNISQLSPPENEGAGWREPKKSFPWNVNVLNHRKRYPLTMVCGERVKANTLHRVLLLLSCQRLYANMVNDNNTFVKLDKLCPLCLHKVTEATSMAVWGHTVVLRETYRICVPTSSPVFPLECHSSHECSPAEEQLAQLEQRRIEADCSRWIHSRAASKKSTRKVKTRSLKLVRRSNYVAQMKEWDNPHIFHVKLMTHLEHSKTIRRSGLEHLQKLMPHGFVFWFLLLWAPHSSGTTQLDLFSAVA